jgi:cytochrome P450
MTTTETTLTSNATRVTQPQSPGLIEIAWQIRTKGALQFFMDQWRAQGDLPHLRMGRHKLVFVVHPDHVRHVLVTGRQGFDKLQTWEGSRQLLLGDGLIASTGELWKRQRRLMSSFFTPRSIEQYYAVMLAAAEATAQRWESIAGSGRLVDMLDEMTRVTASIILRSMFGMDISEQRLRSLEGDVEDMILFVNRREGLPLKPPLWAPLPSHRRYRAARARVHALIREVIARRRAEPQASWPNDLLSKLMLARDEETGETMSDRLVHDESLWHFRRGPRRPHEPCRCCGTRCTKTPRSESARSRSWTRSCREIRRRRSITSSGFRTRCGRSKRSCAFTRPVRPSLAIRLANRTSRA